MKLRLYQETAIAKVYLHFETSTLPGLVVMPTGTGKSYVIAELVRRIVSPYPQTRIIIATHSQELVAQNFQELISIWNEAPAGIYSAGLNKRDVYQKILFVGIQSVYNKAFILQRCDILLVDEAHTIPRESQTMWGKFISDLLIINKHMRVIGLSATPYRMDSGNLIEGEDSLFKTIIYEYSILEAIQDGYLCEIVPKSMATKLIVTKTQMSSEKKLEEAVNVDSITKACVEEIFQYGHDRGTWLIFASGVDHAIAVAAEITSRGVDCAVITGKTDKGVRSRILASYKNGTQRAVSNNKVLTTGVNVPRIDLIADLNPTESKGLFVQKAGRGTRPIYAPGYDLETVEGRLLAIAASSKPNCLLLDFANNLPRHGCIDKIKGKAPVEGDGVAPIKDCPGKLPDGTICCTILHAAVMTCHICGFKFPEPELNIMPVATNHAVLSTQVERKYRRVLSVRYARHEKKGSKHATLRVDYMVEGFLRVSEWICLEHFGTPKQKALNWWKRRAEGVLTDLPAPATIDEALGMVCGLKVASEVVTLKTGQYDEIIGYKFAEGIVPSTVEKVEKVQDFTLHPSETEHNYAVMQCDDDIPF